MKKAIVSLSLFALITTNLAAQSPQVESLDAAGPFAITAVDSDFAGAEKLLTIRARVSASANVEGALLRVAIFTEKGQCRVKAAYRRDLTPADRDWSVRLSHVESTDKVFVSADLGQKRTADEKRKYDSLLAKGLDRHGMKPMFGQCLHECRYFQADCSMTCFEGGYGSCTDCYNLYDDECSCMICQCKPSPVNCDDNPCRP